MNEMVLTMSCSASSSSFSFSASFYFFPSGLTHRRENIACPTPLKGLHPILFSAVTDVVAILSERHTPFDPPCAHRPSNGWCPALVQPTKSLKIALRIFHRAWRPGHHSFIGGKSYQAHHLEPRSLPSSQGQYLASQPASLWFLHLDKPPRQPLWSSRYQ